MSSLALVVLLLPIAGSLVMHLSTCPVQHQRGVPSAQTRSCSTPLMLASSTPPRLLLKLFFDRLLEIFQMIAREENPGTAETFREKTWYGHS